MKLLTKQIALAFPALYATENVPAERKAVVCKFFNPCGAGTWYCVEANARLADGSEIPLAEATAKGIAYSDVIFYGYVELLENEWGYFTLSELESVKLPFGLHIERDLYFHGKTVADLKGAA